MQIKNLLNFTVGPVQSSDAVLNQGALNTPYFRTPEFSALMLENERLICQLAKAPAGSHVCTMTGSGTASMEAVVANCFTSADKVLVVNGGSFGHRFLELTEIYGIPHTEIRLDYGKPLTIDMLDNYDGKGYTGLLVNVHETSTGVLYDIEMIARFCKKNGLFLVVDAISSFLCDPFDMTALGVDVMIAGSQKALACPPGISLIVLSPEAQKRVYANSPRCMYLDLKLALKNGERGQTPFTPAVTTIIQINIRLYQICQNGGADAEINRINALAEDFRSKIKHLPFEIASKNMSNAVTPLKPLTAKASDIFRILKDEYDIWICPNGGALADTLFRVGHIGNLTIRDNDRLIDALEDMQRRGII